MDWRTSTYSNANGGDCVEVGDAAHVVLVRDTKRREGATLTFSAEVWQRFTDALR
jgi:hypothetical protein